MAWLLCKFPRALVTNYHKHRGFKTTDIYFLTVLEAGSPKWFSGSKNQGMDKG